MKLQRRFALTSDRITPESVARLIGICTYNWQWRKFFEINNIEPLKLEYMEVINDFRGTVIKTLKHLGIQMSLNDPLPNVWTENVLV